MSQDVADSMSQNMSEEDRHFEWLENQQAYYGARRCRRCFKRDFCIIMRRDNDMGWVTDGKGIVCQSCFESDPGYPEWEPAPVELLSNLKEMIENRDHWEKPEVILLYEAMDRWVRSLDEEALSKVFEEDNTLRDAWEGTVEEERTRRCQRTWYYIMDIECDSCQAGGPVLIVVYDNVCQSCFRKDPLFYKPNWECWLAIIDRQGVGEKMIAMPGGKWAWCWCQPAKPIEECRDCRLRDKVLS